MTPAPTLNGCFVMAGRANSQRCHLFQNIQLACPCPRYNLLSFHEHHPCRKAIQHSVCVYVCVCMCSRPESADGVLSPCRSSTRNGEKDWENGSTTSSVTSNTEYTGRAEWHALYRLQQRFSVQTFKIASTTVLVLCKDQCQQDVQFCIQCI